MYECKILADSVNSHANRLTTFCVTYPRFIHSEFLTHGMLVRNSESSRARPVQKNVEDVKDNPFCPEAFGRNQPGMQFATVLDKAEAQDAEHYWVYGAEQAIWVAEHLAQLEVHKSYANRVLEPYKWHTAIYSATDWSNFFALRTHRDAQKEFQIIALMMQEAYLKNDPRHLSSGEWHVPFVSDEEMFDEANGYPEPFTDWELWKQVSVGRCARISYLTHEGKRDLDADTGLCDRLLASHHMSPFGHVARPFSGAEWHAIGDLENEIHHRWKYLDPNFCHRLARNLAYCAQYKGFWQYRAEIPNEHDASLGLAIA